MKTFLEFTTPLRQQRKQNIIKRGYEYTKDADEAFERVLIKRYRRYNPLNKFQNFFTY